MRPIRVGRKTRPVYLGAGALMLAVPATALADRPFSFATARARSADAPAARPASAKRPARPAAERGCAKLFTVNMGEGAANLIYSTTSPVTLHDLQVLGYIERCQRNPAAQGFVRGYDRSKGRLHHQRVVAARAATQTQGQSSQSQTQEAAGDASSGLEGCIIEHESGGNPQAANGQYEGLGQWSPAAWAEDGGTQYAPSPSGASAAQQEAVLNSEGAAGMQQQQGQYDGC